MPLVIDDARQLINRRVRVVRMSGDEITAPLRGVSADGTVLLLDVDTLQEIRILDAEIVEWKPFRCSSCGDEVDTIHDGLCASCYRYQAAVERDRGPHVTPCDKCGKTPAFRNPKGIDNRDLLCSSCHLERGDLPQDFGIIVHSFPFAKCVGADIDSPKHQWKQVRSGRWHCAGYGCNIDRYTPPRWRT